MEISVKKDKVLGGFLVPVIIIEILFILMLPAYIVDKCAISGIIRYLCVIPMVISILVGEIVFKIPFVIYVILLVIYTASSWTWILKQKKGSASYYILWLLLGLLSVFLYHKLEPLYHAMFNG